MRTATTPHSAKERVLEAADKLFYRQGYQATGINQIIKTSGVAKASLYAHFASKDALGLTYIRERAARELAQMREGIAKRRTPRERFLAILQDWQAWLTESQFRGCAFANMATEVMTVSPPIRKELCRHEEAFRALFRSVTEELARSESSYQRLDIAQVAESYYLLARGAIVACQLYQDLWPLRRAMKAAEALIRP